MSDPKLSPQTSAAPTPLPWDGQPYSVKRFGVTITNCDSEPVQTPGCIQSHGALLVLRRPDLSVLQVSENAEAILGLSTGDILGQSVSVVLGTRGQEALAAAIERDLPDGNTVYAHTLTDRGGPPLDITVHTADGVAVVEVEATGRGGLESEPDYYDLITTSVARFRTAETVAEYAQTVAREFRAVTGLDRVMVYKFHPDDHGEVVAEAKRDDLEPFLGLHYPADDIPRPAREIFNQIWVRPVADVGAELAELVPLANPETGKPLTMTHCALRGPSVMYTEYLQNMGVRAALTMPLRTAAGLWGLVAGHHYDGPFPTDYRLRAACEFLAQSASLQLESVESRQHLRHRIEVEAAQTQAVLKAAADGELPTLLENEPALLAGMAACGVALYYRDRWWTHGVVPPEVALDELGLWLNGRPEFSSPSRPMFVTDCLSREYPPAKDYAVVASGVLAFPLSRVRGSLLVWFRPETEATITWAGDPTVKPTVTGPHGARLTPRGSFALFTESVRGRSLPWQPFEVEAAGRFRVLVMELVVSRAERLADLNADLSRSNEELDAFAYVASHDLKEPLRGINKYAHQLLDEAKALSEDQRRKLESLARLTVRMDGLLDSLLYFSRVGRVDLVMKPVPFAEVVNEALEMVEARRAAAGVEVVIPRELPTVLGDRVQVREVLVNLLSNAMKYNDKPQKRIEIGYVKPGEAADRSARPVDSGSTTVYFVRDNGIGIQARHFNEIFKIFKRLHPRDAFGGGTGAGMTIVRRLVDRHGGRVWIESEVGVGTTVYFTLAPFGEKM